MGVDINHYVVFGVKLEGTPPDSDDEFSDMLFDKHNAKWDKVIDHEKIYYIPDCYCGDYTVVGYVLDRASFEEDFDFTTIDDIGSYDNEKIIEFLWQDGFKGFWDDKIPDSQLMIFTHAS